MNLRGKIELLGMSDVGRKRSHNEDSIGSDQGIGLAILADGMGGYKAGEVASAIAVNVVMDEVRQALKRGSPEDIDEDSGYCMGSIAVRDAISKANEVIYNTAQSQPQCRGMGTTLVTALFYDDRVTVAHVGDSRLYRLRNEHFEQLTVDHSLLQELVDKGFYTPEEARNSVQRNLVTRAMGVDPVVKSDVVEEAVLPGDVYLMCSDGLSDLIEDGDIHLTLEQHSANLGRAADALIAMANDKGGTDNISVLLAKTLKPFPARSGKSWYSKVFDWFS